MKKILVEIVQTPVGFARPSHMKDMFTCVPPDIACAMFEEMLRMQELIDLGERCAKCGRLELPEDLAQGLCSDCLFDIVMDDIAKQEEAEIAALEATAKFLETIALMRDDYPIDIRLF